jgi:hypothetical protein
MARTKAQQAKKTVRAYKPPSHEGAKGLNAMASLVAQELSSPYLESMFTGEACRSPVEPTGPTALVSDRKRLEMIYSEELGSTLTGRNYNQTLLHPTPEHPVMSTSGDPLVFEVATTVEGPQPKQHWAVDFDLDNSDGADYWNLSSFTALASGGKRGLYPYVGDDTPNTLGYQIFDQAWLANAAAVSYIVTGGLYLVPNVEIGLADEWSLRITTRTADGSPLQTLLATTSLGSAFHSGDRVIFSVALTAFANAEYVTFDLEPDFNPISMRVSGTLQFAAIAYNENAYAPTYQYPDVYRALAVHDLSVYKTIPFTMAAMRQMTGLFSYSGPQVSQGGTISITRVNPRERVEHRDLIDYFGSRGDDASYTGPLLHGGYGVWVPATRYEMSMHAKCVPPGPNTSYLACVSKISDASIKLNIVLAAEFGLEGTTLNNAFHKEVAGISMAPDIIFNIANSMKHFSSNDNHNKEVVNPAKRLRNEAAKANSGKKSTLGKVLGGFKKAAEVVGMIAPALLALI